MQQCSFAFLASTGRTATMFIASTLDALEGVVGLHEGHTPGDPPVPRLPLINLHNRRAWYDDDMAAQFVADLRSTRTLATAAAGASLLIDAAYYNAPLLACLAKAHPTAPLLAVFRRCEGFVRSATLVSGEDLQPAGWPDRHKALTDREVFISMGRLKPRPDTDDAARWEHWTAIQRNIWLWTAVNAHLLEMVRTHDLCHALRYETLAADPRRFWTELLSGLGIAIEENLEVCIARSARRVNQRDSYQVPGLDGWSDAERALYEERALPLENAIYA